jgi:SAM-dependent methyltransferase
MPSGRDGGILGIPLALRAMLRTARKTLLGHECLRGSHAYWIHRYETGGDSGAGSHGQLRAFKAEVLNRFVREHAVTTVVEYGCGDGHQLLLAQYPSYLGFDISSKALSWCRAKFRYDPTKSFRLMSEYRGERAQSALSLDVIFHIVEDDIYEAYMERLFDSAERFVVIYSSDTEQNSDDQAPHVRHRQFTAWVRTRRPQWKLVHHIPNRFAFGPDCVDGSFSAFYIYEREGAAEAATIERLVTRGKD